MTAAGTVATTAPLIFDVDINGPDAPDSVGLSRGHNGPCQQPRQPIDHTNTRRTFKGYVAEGGRLVRVTARSPADSKARAWRRGTVDGFSAKSRGRLLQLVNSINLDRHARRPIFLTLTYPENWPPGGQRPHRDIKVLWKRMVRGWVQTDRKGRLQRVDASQSACIYRIEEQERGAPHFHCLIFGLRYIDRFEISRMWDEVVGSGDANHYRAGTKIEWPEYWSKAGAYVAKYIAKHTAGVPPPEPDAGEAAHSWQAFHALGRVWGVLGRKNLPVDVAEYDLSDWAFEALKEVLIENREDEQAEGFRRAPFRGLWGTCGPGPPRPVLITAGLIEEGEHAN